MHQFGPKLFVRALLGRWDRLPCAADSSSSTGGKTQWRAIGERSVAITNEDVGGVEIVGVALPNGMDILGEVVLASGASDATATGDAAAAVEKKMTTADVAAVLDGLEVRLYASGAQQPMRVVAAPKSRHFQFFGLPKDDYKVVVAQRSGTAGRGVVNSIEERTAVVPLSSAQGPAKVFVTYGIASGDGAQEISIGSVLGLLVIVAMTFLAVKKDEVEVFVKQWQDKRSESAHHQSSSSSSSKHGRGSNSNRR